MGLDVDEFGPPPDRVSDISNTFRANLTNSEGKPLAAIEATAAQQRLLTAVIEEILICDGRPEDELGNISGGLLKSGQ